MYIIIIATFTECLLCCRRRITGCTCPRSHTWPVAQPWGMGAFAQGNAAFGWLPYCGAMVFWTKHR